MPGSVFAAVLGLALCLGLGAGCSAEPQETDTRPARAGRTADTVVRVSDGDTIVLAELGATRLIGIDTPEVHGQAECYGREASRFTKRVLPAGRAVEYRLGVEPRDRYGRALAYVWLRRGRMVNLLLAERGFAQQLTIPPNVDYAERFRRAVAAAREAGRGLWGEAGCATGDGDTAGGTRRCSDFTTQAEAQRWWERAGRPPGMDGDEDGRVCESLP